MYSSNFVVLKEVVNVIKNNKNKEDLFPKIKENTKKVGGILDTVREIWVDSWRL